MNISIVKVGQVWKDRDKRRLNRHLRVIEIPKDLTAPGARATLQPCKLNGQFISTRTTRILVSRMRPTSTEFDLVKDVD
jgi:hypothetical protein